VVRALPATHGGAFIDRLAERYGLGASGRLLADEQATTAARFLVGTAAFFASTGSGSSGY
jgi:hypothetical protein